MRTKKTRKTSSKAEEVAKAMAANMAANMADPNFEQERERRFDEAAKKALNKHKKDLSDVGIAIPKK